MSFIICIVHFEHYIRALATSKHHAKKQQIEQRERERNKLRKTLWIVLFVALYFISFEIFSSVALLSKSFTSEKESVTGCFNRGLALRNMFAFGNKSNMAR